MNFFRKKDHIFASFAESELRDNPEKFKSSLLSLLPVNKDMEIRLSIVNVDDLPAGITAVITGFSVLLRSLESRLIVTVNEKLQELLLEFNMDQELILKKAEE
jgi:hypothetical protein